MLSLGGYLLRGARGEVGAIEPRLQGGEALLFAQGLLVVCSIAYLSQPDGKEGRGSLRVSMRTCEDSDGEVLVS